MNGELSPQAQNTGWNLIATIMLCLVAWRAHIALDGELVRATYRASGGKLVLIGFLDGVLFYVVIPLVIVFLVSSVIFLAKRNWQFWRSYRHGLIAAAAWTAFMLFGTWYAQTHT